MKVNVGALLAFAALGLDINIDPPRYIDPRAKRLRTYETERPVWSAPEELRVPLLKGRKGKGTRRSRKS